MKMLTRLSKKSTFNLFLLLLTLGFSTLSCSDDDENPTPVDEEEVITTMNITLSNATENITLQSQDLDGDGPEPPMITISGNLSANTSYSGTIVLLNETSTPSENITEEVKEEDDEHQFFFTINEAITGVDYEDQDENGNPVGIDFTLTTGDAGNGTLQVTLRHQPKKPNDGSLADAGGDTDIAQTFALVVE